MVGTLRGRERMSNMIGFCTQGIRKWVPSPITLVLTPWKRSKMTARWPPSTETEQDSHQRKHIIHANPKEWDTDSTLTRWPLGNFNKFYICNFQIDFSDWLRHLFVKFHQPRLVIRTFHRQGRCSRGGHLCNEHSEEKYSCSYK